MNIFKLSPIALLILSTSVWSLGLEIEGGAIGDTPTNADAMYVKGMVTVKPVKALTLGVGGIHTNYMQDVNIHEVSYGVNVMEQNIPNNTLLVKDGGNINNRNDWVALARVTVPITNRIDGEASVMYTDGIKVTTSTVGINYKLSKHVSVGGGLALGETTTDHYEFEQRGGVIYMRNAF